MALEGFHGRLDRERQEEFLKRLDEEHHKLEEAVDRLAQMLATGHVPRILLDDLLNLLELYAFRHFRHEEEFFTSLLPEDDPDRKRNEAEHRSFRDWLEAFEQSYRKVGSDEELADLGRELHQKLASWLADHGKEVDRPLVGKIRTFLNRP